MTKAQYSKAVARAAQYGSAKLDEGCTLHCYRRDYDGTHEWSVRDENDNCITVVADPFSLKYMYN